MSIPKFLAATAAVGGLAFFTAGAAGASSTNEDPLAALKELCEKRGGLPVKSPYSISRCQGARANKGFEAERLICEGLGNAELVVSYSTTHMNRASWSCTSTVPVR
jgi:hypothetical protein